MAVIILPGTKETYIGTFIECIIYGVYLSVFYECCLLFWRKDTARTGTGSKHIYLIATTALMFIVISMRCVIDIIRLVAPIYGFGDTFGPFSGTLAVITNVCWIAVTVLADTFMLFRTIVVWNKRWPIIALPSLLCIADIGAGIWSVSTLVNTADQPVFTSALARQAMIVFIPLTMATNVLCTSLIAFRILQVQRQVAWMVSGSPRPGLSYGMRILSVVVESATIYTLLLIGFLISGRFNSYAVYLLVDIASPTIGLIFSYIIIRVSRGTSYGEKTELNPTMTSIPRVRRHSSGFEHGQSRSMRFGARSEVQVTLEMESNDERASDNPRVGVYTIPKYPDT
ncbi:hypothetical protein B0H19DRAFT_1270103 [Mycena capillaripes]|nr:hypothetical protein B0H19DRAFT_1270103 [Mycena capillaripes]